MSRLAQRSFTASRLRSQPVRVVVVLPTFNEVENIAGFLRAVRDAVPEADVLVIDDNSPDGTADLAEETAS